MSANDDTATFESQRGRVRGALTRYRVLAWITGLWLLLLVAELVCKYLLHLEMPSWVVAVPIIHGWVYLVYLMLTLDLAIKVRWPIATTILTLLAGTIPFLSFYVEHQRTRQVRSDYRL